ncbi:Dabb family protein [Leucobacter japonicus]|uniref:Dabb family protein n=1 Tax=Leucobacter japonicus TaxID=1461259 RepID=UPI0006A7AB9B|nr:Dabb family protein [Leucobacter japonicus]
MILHVVTFACTPGDDAHRARCIERLRGALEPLAATIPGVRSLRVGVDESGIDGHWDAVLLSTHDSAAALAEYQAHPAHVAALAVVGEVVAAKSVVDCEIPPGP